jgi:hypothetical protein
MVKTFYEIRHRIAASTVAWEDGVCDCVLNARIVESYANNNGVISFRSHTHDYIVHPDDTGTFMEMIADWSVDENEAVV